MNEAFESGWSVLKATRGTSARWYDDAKQRGVFPPRYGAKAFDANDQMKDITGVWAADASEPYTAFNYAMSKDPQNEPLVHTLTEPGAVPQNQDNDQMAVRAMRYDAQDFPEGVPSQNAEKVWHGPSFETYMQNPSIRPEHKNMASYQERMKRDYRRSAAQFFRNKGATPLDFAPEHNAYPQRLRNNPRFSENRGEEWARAMAETPGEDADWAFQQSLKHVDKHGQDHLIAQRERMPKPRTNREAILPPTLTGNEKPWWKRERSTIAPWHEARPRDWIGRDKGWDWNTGENRGKWADILMTDEEKQERARKKQENSWDLFSDSEGSDWKQRIESMRSRRA